MMNFWAQSSLHSTWPCSEPTCQGVKPCRNTTSSETFKNLIWVVEGDRARISGRLTCILNLWQTLAHERRGQVDL